jgi:dTDP-4-dehydrorhamnose reductase
VFDGELVGPYSTDAEPNPIQYYGETKLWGEKSVLHPEIKTPMVAVVRAAWLFGATKPNHKDFPNAIAAQLLKADSAEVTKHGLGAPTSVDDLAEYLLRLGTAPDAEFAGLHHAVAAGATSWFDFAQRIASDLGFGPDAIRERVEGSVEGEAVGDQPPVAKRPANSVLKQTAVSGYQIDHWSAGWHRYLPTLRTRLGLPDLAR